METDVLLETHTAVTETIERLKEIQTQMHQQYKDYTEKNKTNKVFGLDSFHYQCRLLDLNIKQLNDQYAFINNRMYCDYYKLYNMVKQYYKDGFKLEPKKKTFTIYKDLEPYKLFDFNDILQLNKELMEMIATCYGVISKTEDDINTSMSNTKSRFNIDPFIFNHRYNNSMLKTKIELYEKYLHSYHIYHMSFLSHLLDKLGLLFKQSTNTVNIEKIEDWNHRPLIVQESEDVLKKEFVMIHEDPQNKVEIEIEKVVWNTPIPQVLAPLESPVVMPVIEPLPVPEPATEPIIESLSGSVIEPATDSIIESLSESVIEPATESLSGSVIEPATEPATEPVTEPIIESLSGSVVGPATNSVIVPAPGSVSDTVPDPVEGPDESVNLLDPVKETKKKKKKKR